MVHIYQEAGNTSVTQITFDFICFDKQYKYLPQGYRVWCMFVVILSESEGDGWWRIQLRGTTRVTIPCRDGQLRVQVTSLMHRYWQPASQQQCGLYCGFVAASHGNSSSVHTLYRRLFSWSLAYITADFNGLILDTSSTPIGSHALQVKCNYQHANLK